MTGVAMTREEVRDLCRQLGFDPGMVSQILVYPNHVEVTVAVPIIEQRDEAYPPGEPS